jgi:hypothetical protein
VGLRDCYPVYLVVVVITEVQELLPGELGPIVSDDRVGNLKEEDDILDKAYHLFGADFGQEPSLNPLSELVDHDKQVGEAPEHFFEGSQEVQAPHDKGPCDGDGLKLLGWCVDLPRNVLAPLARLHNPNCVAGSRQLVKILSEGFTDHAH